jgi:hypothetical protein
MTEITYTHNNKDDTHKAIECLDEFTHNWCMDCEETDKQHEPMFKCNKCIFRIEDGKCMIKKFKCINAPSYKNFGCMGDL